MLQSHSDTVHHFGVYMILQLYSQYFSSMYKNVSHLQRNLPSKSGACNIYIALRMLAGVMVMF